MTTPVTDLQRGGAGTPLPPPGPTLLGLLSLLQPQYRWTRKMYFVYGTDFNTLAGSTTTTNTIGIAGDSDFIVTFANCIVTDSTQLIQLPFIPQLVQLTDSSLGMAFFLTPQHANNVYGDGMNPGIFPSPYVLRQATSLAVQHQNLETTARVVRCGFMGFKSYPQTDTRYKQWQG